MIDERAVGERYRAVAGERDERRRRLGAAAEARSHGRGGIAAVARATGIAENTIRAGLRELGSGQTLAPRRVRRRAKTMRAWVSRSMRRGERCGREERSDRQARPGALRSMPASSGLPR